MPATSPFKAIVVIALFIPLTANAADLVTAQAAQQGSSKKCMDQCSSEFHASTGKCNTGNYNKNDQGESNRCIQHARSRMDSCSQKCGKPNG